MLTTEHLHGTALETADLPPEWQDQEPIVVNGDNGKAAERWLPFPAAPGRNGAESRQDSRPVLALFCFEDPGSVIGRFVSGLAGALAQRQLAVHLFSRRKFEPGETGVTCHVLENGLAGDTDIVEQAEEFGRQACNAFLQVFHAHAGPITVMGCEWSSVLPLTLLQGIKNHPVLLSLYSLERQRSDMSSDLNKRIEEIELTGLRIARSILVRDPGTGDAVKSCFPECAARVVVMPEVFPVEDFATPLDAGQIKARYQVGPIDPTMLFIGDLSEPYGPDILIKAMPAILKNHPQARFILVGNGDMYWTLRVYARYLLLEHAVRFVGSVNGGQLNELIQAADVVVVPSRTSTPWWPILAAWAAKRPVAVSREATSSLLVHEQDGVLFYPNENSCVWGVERILYDAELAKSLGRLGHEKLLDRFGWNGVARQIEEFMGVAANR